MEEPDSKKQSEKLVAGLKEFLRYAQKEQVEKVYLARDVDEKFMKKVLKSLGNAQVVYVESKEVLQKMAEIEVPCGIICQLKAN